MLSFDNSKKLLNLLSETKLEGHLSVEEWKLYNDACIEYMPLKARFLVQEDKLFEAIQYVDCAISSEVESFFGVGNRDKVLTLQKDIREEIEEVKKWDSISAMSDDEFLRFLFKRLVFRLHPDFERDEIKRVEKTKIMQEINQIHNEKDLMKLEKVVRQHVPKWSKYLRHKK